MAWNGVGVDKVRFYWQLTNDNYLILINWKYVSFNNDLYKISFVELLYFIQFVLIMRIKWFGSWVLICFEK